MVSVNLSIDQLIETIKGLNEEEKIQIKFALDNDFYVSDEKLADLVKRKQDLIEGKIGSRSWEEIKREYESV
ncbi:hypothetical protein SAMN04487995_4791 [Dyadobacter koreensis]|uniref:Uncharacterized protein n=1 Tax=Dyadobacter koreensis TaxID=408657 RepID=A0A1H6Z0V2_9BACT|nr:hypothetical protein [Dyadobacter koreensis]SEJ46296.1 hypothetical protein SAMN04487995_4791 [Dyadobacter koreensis]